jgi:hypothetical protein
MNRKIILILLLLSTMCLVSGCAKQNLNVQNNNQQNQEISDEEKEFNESGRAKAILDPKDMLSFLSEDLQGKWMAIDDEDVIVEFKDNKK